MSHFDSLQTSDYEEDESTSKYKHLESDDSRMTPFIRTLVGGGSVSGAMRVGVDFRRDSLDVEAT